MTAEMAGAGRPGCAWAAFVAGRAALILPRSGEADWSAPDEDRWHSQTPGDDWQLPHPHWSATLAGDTVRIRHAGKVWLETGLGPTWLEWNRAARTRGSVLLVAGPFADHHGFVAATRSRTLRLLVVPLADIHPR